MSELRFTPGPWRTEKIKYGDHWVGTDEADIAVVEGFGDDLVEESAANARLIAASPRMYKYIANRAQEGDDDAASIIATI